MNSRQFLELCTKKCGMVWQYRGKPDEQVSCGNGDVWLSLRATEGRTVHVYAQLQATIHNVWDIDEVLAAAKECKEVLECIIVRAHRHHITLVYKEQE